MADEKDYHVDETKAATSAAEKIADAVEDISPGHFSPIQRLRIGIAIRDALRFTLCPTDFTA